MRLWYVMAVVVCLTLGGGSTAVAQDEPKPDQLKKMYDDALVQLKAAQDRKNELATENEKLNAKVAELKKQLDDATVRAQTLEQQVAGFAEQTFYLRSHYAAFQNFLRSYPNLMSRWKLFMENDLMTVPHDVPASVFDPSWPLSVEG